MAGRPSKYYSNVEPKLLLIEAWARDGLTDADICKNLDVGKDAFIEYKKQYPELADALKRNKEEADIIVENSLYKRAIGYTYEEVTREQVPCRPYEDESGNMIEHKLVVTKVVTKEVQPDTTAQIFWLKNRKKEVWRDRHDIDVKSEVVNKHEYHIEQTITTDPESAELLKQLYKRSLVASMADPSKA